MLVVPDAISRGILTAITGVAGELNGAKVKLFMNNVVPTRHSLFGDFTEATFTGYVESSAITWGTTFTNSAGQAEADGDVKQFLCTTTGVSNTIYGYYVVDTTGLILLYAERFDSPQPIGNPGDAVVIVPRFTVVSQQV